MKARPLAIHRVGLLTAVGAEAASSCAAFRAKLTNPTPTTFMNSSGEWITAHQVGGEWPDDALDRLAAMAGIVIREVMVEAGTENSRSLPVLLCVAEKERPGRFEGLDDKLLDLVEERLGARFAPSSAIVGQGRIGVAVAMAQAREMIDAGAASRVLIVAVDTLLSASSLEFYERRGRLLTQDNSNGFMPGEGAGALLVGLPSGKAELVCAGVGFATESAHIDSDEPLRAAGLTAAIRAMLKDAELAMHEFDYRITDLSGEQYYFKEAALALARTLRERKPEFDLWHPAECTGEAGALAGTAIVALADAAARKGFAKGLTVLAHMANDAGERAALALQFRAAS